MERRLTPAARPPARVAHLTRRVLGRRGTQGLLGAVAAPAVLAAACGSAAGPSSGGSGAPASGAPAGTVTFAYLGDDQVDRIYNELADDAERATPGLKVERLHTAKSPGSGSHMEKVEALIAAGSPPDMTWLSTGFHVAYGARGAAVALDPFMQRDKEFKLDDWYVGATDGFKYAGKTYGLPRELNMAVVYYNLSHFEKAGLPAPRDGWTWDDFLDTARKLTTGTPGQADAQYGFGLFPAWWRLYPWMWQNGGDAWAKDGSRTTIDQAPAYEAVQWVADLRWRHRVAPRPGETTGDDFAHFAQGKVSMAVENPGYIARLRASPDVRWDIAPLPKGPAKRANNSLGGGFAVLSATRRPDAAWAVLRILAGQKGHQLIFESSGWAPPRKSLASLPAMQQPTAAPKSIRVFVEESRYLQAPPVSPNWSKAQGELFKALDAVFNDNERAKDVAIRVRDPIDGILKNG
jgi:multiple sugar transport system substrate-binding protein